MRYIQRYEVTLPLGAGGSRLGSYRSLSEARNAYAGKDVDIFKTVYGVSASGAKMRLKSEKII